MKCPKCGERIFSLTKAGEEALEELGYDIKKKEEDAK